MVYVAYKLKFWNYLQGNFLYRVHLPRLRKGVKILMAVVIGALLLAGLYVLFGDTILPTLTQKIKDLFNFTA